jgi:cellulose synthase/poly-beta-1,6-N-acetylglucosamine synthase-like glycosyltransferase
VGKFAALTAAIGAAPPSDVLAFCDADLSPHPDWLLQLVAPFSDPVVGGSAAFVSPANTQGAVARYGCLEAWVHQLITSAAKDRLALDPPTLGACAYRRTAFEAVGGFAAHGAGADVQIASALGASGWRTRFVRSAVVESAVVFRWRDYWHQHVRWARNMLGTARVPRATRLSVPLRIERALAASGYADRGVLVVVTALTLAGAVTPWVVAGYAAILTAEIAAAVGKAQKIRELPLFLGAAAVGLGVDVAASVSALALHVWRRPHEWRQATRPV